MLYRGNKTVDNYISKCHPSTENLFSHGIPDALISDNGPQYSAKEFEEFIKIYDFTHITIVSPYHPQGNSEVERAVKTGHQKVTEGFQRS